MGDQRKKKDSEYQLKLFVSGASPNSIRAINNLKVICDSYLKEKYTLEIIDVHQDASLAQREQMVALPLLIKKSPAPERRLVGDLSNTQKVLNGLGILD